MGDGQIDDGNDFPYISKSTAALLRQLRMILPYEEVLYGYVKVKGCVFHLPFQPERPREPAMVISLVTELWRHQGRIKVVTRPIDKERHAVIAVGR